jgi:putative tricarboxylic transport membrane protein
MTRILSEEGRRPDRAAFIIAGLLAVTGLILLREGFAMPDRGGYSGVGPGGAPKLVGACLLAIAAAHVVSGLRGTLGARAPQNPVPAFWITGGLALQIALLPIAGFSIAAAVLFAFTAAAFNERRWHISLPSGVVLGLIIYGVFDRLLSLNLPAGPIETLLFGG